MHRRAYVLLIAVAAVMSTLAVITSISVDRPLVDPEGFLGPGWTRIPLMLAGAFLGDMLPRVVFQRKGARRPWKDVVRERWRSHWNRDRVTLVVLGLASFYLTYVSYRNLKSFLPFVLERKYDRELHQLDQALFFGHEPAVVLHNILGEGISAHILSTIYLWFLPLVPFCIIAWVVWSRNISYGYWFVTSQVLVWSLGTASYYALPTLGPGFAFPWLYEGLSTTGSTDLMDALFYGRSRVRWEDFHGVNSVAGFASLHCAVTLLVALSVQYTVRVTWLRWVMWINFAITVVATLYFGWHYIADDVAGCLLAVVSFYVGGVASGQKFDRRGLGSHPTTLTASVPVDQD